MNTEDETTPPTASPASIWERMAQRPHAPRPALTHDRIAETAIRVADAEGLEAVSMRRLGSELGVAAMTFYRYVSSKEDVLELMVDNVRREILLDDPQGDWRSVLRSSALRFRVVILRHPWVIDLPGKILLAPTPGLLAVAEQNLAALDLKQAIPEVDGDFQGRASRRGVGGGLRELTGARNRDSGAGRPRVFCARSSRAGSRGH